MKPRARWPAALPWLLACLLPAAVCAWAIVTYAVPAPHDDVLVLVRHNAPFRDGTAGIRDLFFSVNEHRVLFPALFLLPQRLWLFHRELIPFSPAHYRVIFVEGFLLALANAALLLLLLRRTAGALSPASRGMLALVCCSFVFSLSFSALWTWSSHTFFFSVTCVLAALLLLARPGPGRWLPAAPLAFMSTFSLASGLAAWPALLPLVLARARRRLPAALAWCGIAAAVTVLYLLLPAESPDVGYVPAVGRYPLSFLRFLATLLGSPLTPQMRADVAIGWTLLLCAAAAVVLVRCRRDPALRRRLLPWICLAAFGLIAGCLITAGRLNFGLTAALWSRYNALTYPFALGILVCLALSLPKARVLHGMLVLLAVAVQAWWIPAAVGRMEEETARIERGYACFRVYEVASDACLSLLKRGWDVRALAADADRMGLLERFTLPERLLRERAASGAVEGSRAVRGGVSVRGWAALPGCRPPDHVVFTTASGSRLAGLTVPVFRRGDTPCAGRVGWEVALAPEIARSELELWAHDAEADTLLYLGRLAPALPGASIRP